MGIEYGVGWVDLSGAKLNELLAQKRVNMVHLGNERRYPMGILGNFLHLRPFTDSKLFRIFAPCIVVAIVVAFASYVNADYFRFTVTADNRPNDEDSGAFQHVLSEITRIVGDEGEFHISVGDIDPPLDYF